MIIYEDLVLEQARDDLIEIEIEENKLYNDEENHL